MGISIKSEDHTTCREITAHLKKAVAPWFFQLEFVSESKSARKGDVLVRDLQIKQIAYAPDIIVFAQMLKTLIWHYNLMYKVVIKVYLQEVIPRDGRRNLLG